VPSTLHPLVSFIACAGASVQKCFCTGHEWRARAVERALEILCNVVGLNVDAYNWSVSSYKKEVYWGLLHEFVIFDFRNDESELMVAVVFAD